MLNRVNAPAGTPRAEPGPVAPWERARKAPRPRFEVCLTVAMITCTVVASLLFAGDMSTFARRFWNDGDWLTLGRLVVFFGVVVVLGYGNLIYQVSRLGYFIRLGRHRPVPFDDLVRSTAGQSMPSVAVLVPSYREDPRTIRQTLMSAALQDYPNRRVVLLLDDPPAPSDPINRTLLESGRQAPADIMNLLAEPAGRARRAHQAFLARVQRFGFDPARETDSLVTALAEADAWLEAQAAMTPLTDHTDELFVALTYEAARSLLAETVQRLLTDAAEFDDLDREYRRLVEFFQVEITVFERKHFTNLAWEPNKAANLNAYLGVMGQRVRTVVRDGGRFLDPVGPDAQGDDISLIPDAKYVLTLDADSMLAPSYTRRLVWLMEQPGNERVAVAQTPYSAVPNAPGVLERIAGATTDLQYLIQQGFTWFDATFWVGANALLRKEALEDIRVDETERGFRVPRYIQDRTVIEDTESTIDLVANGWRLLNYQEKLAYSATPPDFGALVIQRRRWANGGLLIFPHLLRYVCSRPYRLRKVVEVGVRAHYLVSLPGSTIAIFLLLFFPLEAGLETMWLPLAAAPYFLLTWRDLLQGGYPVGDIVRLYALNILLLPINIAGMAKSIQQAVTRKKIPFGRTPKVAGRTAAPRLMVLSEWLLLLYCVVGSAWDMYRGQSLAGLVLLSTGAMLAYALVALVGLRESVEDILGTSRPRPRWPRGLRRPARWDAQAAKSAQARVLPSADPSGD